MLCCKPLYKLSKYPIEFVNQGVLKVWFGRWTYWTKQGDYWLGRL